MDDETIGHIIWVGLAVVGGWFAYKFVAAKWAAMDTGAAAVDLTGIVAVALRILLVVLAGWIVVTVVRWVERRRARLRTHQREALLADVGKVVKVAEKRPRMAWRGRWLWGRKQRVRSLAFMLAPGVDLTPDTKAELHQVFRKHLGPVGPPSWPAAHELPWVRVKSGEEVSETETAPAEDSDATRLEKALDGLVPGAKVAEVDSAGGAAFQVAYGETTRDQSGQWRARVVDQASGRLDSKFRATWDRSKRLINLSPLPTLPHPIRWDEAFAEFSKTAEIDALPYGTDEEGRTVCWPIGDRQPHAIAVGGTGSGKTETMKTLIASALVRGYLVAIIDPKAKDFQEFLGKPGVVAVATDLEDRGHLLQAMLAEVHRRNAALALGRLRTQYDSIAAMALPTESKIDAVPILFVVDEVTQMTDDFHGWWAQLSKDTRKEEWGTDSKTPPMLETLPQIAQLARACRIHLLLGMQRADARNFGPNTAMRDNISHLISQDQLKPLGSEMLYGDRVTGAMVEIQSPGEGLSNGSRYRAGELEERHGTPGRFKAWWLADTAESADFWNRVRDTAPDASLIDLGQVSAASSDPMEAARQLMTKAYPGHRPGDTAGITRDEDPPALALVPEREPAAEPEAEEVRDVLTELGAATKVPEDPAKAAVEREGTSHGDVDTQGVEWKHVRLDQLKVGDRVMFIDGDEADVVEVVGEVEDEDFGDELFRLVVDDAQGAGRVVDLSPDEMIERAAA